MVDILLLPTEILEKIGTAAAGDRKSLRCACKQLQNAIEPLLFESLSIDIDSESLQSGLGLLEALAKRHTHIAPYVKRLVILPARTTSDKSPQNDLETKISQLLGPAMQTLTCLRSFTWQMAHHAPPWAVDPVFQCLSQLKSLEEFTCTNMAPCWDPVTPLPIDLLPPLRSIVVFFHGSGVYDTVFKPIAELIKRSPDMSSVSLGYQDDRVTQRTSVTDFLPKNLTGLRLRHLRLDGWDGQYTGISHYLRNLTSCVLSNYHPTDTDLWKVLKQENIHLLRLSASVDADAGLLNYLDWCSGIQELDLRIQQREVDAFAPHFYHDTLPRHAGTLTSVKVLANADGPWCFQKSYLQDLLQCRQLVHLSLCVHINSEYLTVQDDDLEVVTAIIQAIPSFSALRSLCLRPVDLHWGDLNFSSQNSMRHIWSSQDRLEQFLSDFKPPELPTEFVLIVAGREYPVIPSSEGENVLKATTERRRLILPDSWT